MLLYLDPDFRRKPKTDKYCARCHKDLRGDCDYVWVSEDGFWFSREKTEKFVLMPIGEECKKMIEQSAKKRSE